MIFIPRQRDADQSLQRQQDDAHPIRHHFCVIKRTEDPPWLPLRWRIRCVICKAHWIAEGSDQRSWLACQHAAQLHAQTGRWPDAEPDPLQGAA